MNRKRRRVFAIGLVVAVGVGVHAAGTPKPGVDWPQFRGIRAGGVAEGFPLAESWDIPSGRGVRWKTAIPGLGLASPIVWNDLVCVSTSVSGQKDAGLKVGLYGDVRPVTDDTEHEWRVYCLDKKSGAVRWQQSVLKAVPKIKRHTKSSHANSTLATDGERLIAFFGSEGPLRLRSERQAAVEEGSRRPRRRVVQRSDGAVGDGQLADPARQRRRHPGGRSEGLVPRRLRRTRRPRALANAASRRADLGHARGTSGQRTHAADRQRLAAHRRIRLQDRQGDLEADGRR